jgi:hypothetical protein
MSITRRSFVTITGIGALGAITTPALLAESARAVALEVYKSPKCGCCGAWVDHMRAAGFDVRVTEMEDLDPIKRGFNVPKDMESCHTGLIDGYVIEGHVPAQDTQRLLMDQPEAIGLSVPGMPIGSPGMEQGSQQDRYKVILFSSTQRTVFARY